MSAHECAAVVIACMAFGLALAALSLTLTVIR
jgi:hypothetical protein